MNDVAEVVTPTSYLTLHYRLAGEDGMDFISTFGGKPSTLQMGLGQLAPTLEDCLLGLPCDAHKKFMLPPEKAFGAHNPQFVQRIGRADLPPNSATELHGTIEIASPHGQKIAGRVIDLDDDTVLLDFNHPLAGRTVCFEVHLIGVM
ncbi:MAG: FKBP-type peptidyl-prolyl cis-trans isomerase [Rhodocyclaceae bacterium]|jgi:FKBP-type peptidyl-prolyl cis-trans isomerase SlpA|nr:FKBP-type peptidyl-prolyl cis-trans isomerase [Rhodocyclaceae bacterium]MBK6907951.1 FKBP-type peptidyl-prolyl cis-trans isomerase [Rhodocyclaceae bacterium]